MLKFVSLAAKSGRREISRQTIRKILPKIDEWDYMNAPYPGLSDLLSRNPNDRDGIRGFAKISALYKYIKHVIIPEQEDQHNCIEGTEKGIKVMGKLCDAVESLCEERFRKKDSDLNRILSTVYCRNGELHRKHIKERFVDILSSDNEGAWLKKEQLKPQNYYSTAIKLLPENPLKTRMITRRYKAVHGYANYALEIVGYWRDIDKNFTQNCARIKPKQGSVRNFCMN